MRIRVMALTALLLSGALPGQGPAPARADGGLCETYCESIYVGCLVTVGRIDREACTEWREGCRDGCRVEIQ